MSNKVGFGREINAFLRELEWESSGEIEESRREASCSRITAITPSGSERVTVRVTVANASGGESVEFSILKVHSERLELAVGIIEDETLPELEYCSEVARAYSSACSSFAFSPSPLKAIWKKLVQKGVGRDVADEAIEILRDSGAINEGDMAIRRAQQLCEKLWGRNRILAKLREDGFEDGAISEAMVSLDEIDFASNCADLIRKRFGEIPRERRELDKMYASLSRMGFSSSDIRAAMLILKRY